MDMFDYLVGLGNTDFRKVLRTPTGISLMLSNLLTIILAFLFSWEVSTILIIFWVEGLIMTLFAYFRIRSLKSFSTEGYFIKGRQAPETEKTRNSFADSFLALSLLLNAGTGMALSVLIIMGTQHSFARTNPFAGIPFILLMAGVFFVNQLYSHNYTQKHPKNKPKIKAIEDSIIQRFFLMETVIMLGGLFFIFTSLQGIPLLLFLLLKTFADMQSYGKTLI